MIYSKFRILSTYAELLLITIQLPTMFQLSWKMKIRFFAIICTINELHAVYDTPKYTSSTISLKEGSDAHPLFVFCFPPSGGRIHVLVRECKCSAVEFSVLLSLSLSLCFVCLFIPSPVVRHGGRHGMLHGNHSGWLRPHGRNHSRYIWGSTTL